ncbi:L,D-transpeptidase [Motiliproteus coralliicola]|uniref:L,D-transpeptidase n=1 Tax=Motiliproteus coralliicola TaxID=2283196 RepID=A0A369WSI4_9GAMM|nr:L,D-transpeptidase [Motiliproteus coralliicola]RDE24133.1 L,D-transpeptidase [Motiliproteus coralliicola]
MNPGRPRILISISQQRLTLLQEQHALQHYPISTAANGTGQQQNSGCTPLGRHRIRAMIGGECPLNSVFVGRRPTGEIYSPELAKRYPERDWILSRILWLCGCEPGFNRLGSVDSMRRYIYIHGTPDTEPMGIPRSHGCIRMRNQDLVALYEQLTPGTEVLIKA